MTSALKNLKKMRSDGLGKFGRSNRRLSDILIQRV